MKIETVPVQGRYKLGHPGISFEEFIATLVKLKAGQSFVMPAPPSSYRTGMTAARVILGRDFISSKEGDGFRVGLCK